MKTKRFYVQHYKGFFAGIYDRLEERGAECVSACNATRIYLHNGYYWKLHFWMGWGFAEGKEKYGDWGRITVSKDPKDIF